MNQKEKTNEVSESTNKRNLVIKEQINKSTEIKIMMEKALRENIQNDVDEDIIRSNIASIITQMVFIRQYKKALKDGFLFSPFLILKEPNTLKNIEQEIREKFHVPKSIPVVYK